MFTPVLMVGFLHSVSSRGPTAAQGVFGHLDFLQRHTKLRLPLDAAIVVRYKGGAVGHMAKQQKPLSLAAYGAMVDVLRSDASLWQKNTGGCPGAQAPDQLPEAGPRSQSHHTARNVHSAHLRLADISRQKGPAGPPTR